MCNWEDRLEILNGDGSVEYIVSGSSCQFGPNCICQSFDFAILKPDGTPTGAMIKNMFPGCARACESAENLMVTFPPDADANHRAALVGATLLIEYMYFMKSKSSDGAQPAVGY